MVRSCPSFKMIRVMETTNHYWNPYPLPWIHPSHSGPTCSWNHRLIVDWSIDIAYCNLYGTSKNYGTSEKGVWRKLQSKAHIRTRRRTDDDSIACLRKPSLHHLKTRVSQYTVCEIKYTYRWKCGKTSANRFLSSFWSMYPLLSCKRATILSKKSSNECRILRNRRGALFRR